MTADEAYAANAASERKGLRDHMVNRQPTQQWIVKTLLDELYGEKDSHDEVARLLLEKFSDAQRSVTLVLRWLVDYKEDGLL